MGAVVGPLLPRPQQCLRRVNRPSLCFSPARRRSNNGGGGTFARSDYNGQGFTGYYDSGGPTTGPLADASLIGAPKITPKLLKQHLDQYVIGQERAKKILSIAVYNHYQRVQELQRREEEEVELFNQQSRRDWVRHPVEDEYPGQQSTRNMNYNAPSSQSQYSTPRNNYAPIMDDSPLNIEKSNVMLLGPSGVGKTLMAKTLARILEVPFSMSDCTPFTQAGYIGEDAEVCVQRLLAAANYDVTRAERGIIVLDEIDKIATAKVSHGKDVSGEGVQQALLKIIEGTTIQVQAKQERNSAASGAGSGSSGRSQNTVPTGSPMGGSTVNAPQPAKGDVYNINTDNILFICTGAFIGLHKTIMDRVAKSSIGFGAQMRTFPNLSSSDSDTSDPTLPPGNPEDDAMFRNNLPFYEPPPTSSTTSLTPNEEDAAPRPNVLDLTTPTDLQKYGIIPELVGRIPITCAVSPLSLSALMRVLVEPRNSLTAQYAQLLHLSGMELRFTSASLYEIAKSAQDMGTGARGLRTVMERLLSESMFECPGSGVRYVLVTEGAARRKEGCRWYGRSGQSRFTQEAADEEEAWERRKRRRKGVTDDDGAKGGFETFSQYRERVHIACSG